MKNFKRIKSLKKILKRLKSNVDIFRRTIFLFKLFYGDIHKLLNTSVRLKLSEEQIILSLDKVSSKRSYTFILVVLDEDQHLKYTPTTNIYTGEILHVKSHKQGLVSLGVAVCSHLQKIKGLGFITKE